MKIQTNKLHSKAQGMQFGWLFAIIIGAFILFFAIYFAGKLISSGTYQSEAELARSLDILLNPFASIGKADVSLSKPVTLPQKTTVNFTCDSARDLQRISVLVEKGKAPFGYDIKNKYIFAEDFNAKNLWVFSKPFKMPWRVDDLIYVISKKYCFVSPPPESIGKELEALNSSMIRIVRSKNECKSGEIKVCFTGVCDISVDGENSRVGNLPVLDDATMYAAIFGPDQYNCNIERLRIRLGNQADIFIVKADVVIKNGCLGAQPLKTELLALRSAIAAKDYATIRYESEKIENDNRISCPLY
jgi:hypothetical protein